jgi:hypothetical protein
MSKIAIGTSFTKKKKKPWKKEEKLIQTLLFKAMVRIPASRLSAAEVLKRKCHNYSSPCGFGSIALVEGIIII